MNTMSDVEYERKNDRIVVAKQDGEQVAKIVQVPGTNTTSFRMKDGTKRGERVEDIQEAKDRIEKYLD